MTQPPSLQLGEYLACHKTGVVGAHQGDRRIRSKEEEVVEWGSPCLRSTNEDETVAGEPLLALGVAVRVVLGMAMHMLLF
jgi:hypothetical protein